MLIPQHADSFAFIEDRFPDWHYDHPRILYALVRSLKPLVAVEVGTYRGYAACYMALALRENRKGVLHCIDDFSEGMQKKYDANHWCDNLEACGLADHAQLIVGKSHEVKWPNRVDFAYIDGWHGYTDVCNDFLKASNRGAECICLDDTDSTVGPALFVEVMRHNSNWGMCELHRDCGLAVFVRDRSKPLPDFSQEDPSNPGVVMTDWSDEQKRSYLAKLGPYYNKLQGW